MSARVDMTFAWTSASGTGDRVLGIGGRRAASATSAASGASESMAASATAGVSTGGATAGVESVATGEARQRKTITAAASRPIATPMAPHRCARVNVSRDYNERK